MPLDRRKVLQQLQMQTSITMFVVLFVSSWILCSAQAQLLSDVQCPSQCTCVYAKKLVNCSNRSLRQIPQPIPTWVSILTFRNNKLTENELKGEFFSNLPNLQELIFSDNRLTRVNLSIRNAPKLRILRLDHCSLSDLPSLNAKAARGITSLSISHNSIKDVGKRLHNWSSLKFLNLSFNRLRHLRNNTFLQQKNLTELYLHRNRISSIEPRAFAGLNHSLESLSLSRNRIRALRNLFSSSLRELCIGFLSNLRYLDLSRNQIVLIDVLTFNGMCKLETLLLNDNAIATLKDGSFYSLKALQRMNLDNNLVGSVNLWLFDLEMLHTLSLHNNNVSQIVQESWKFSKEIRHLNLSSNKLALVSNGLFRQLPKLEELDLSKNSIEVMENNAFEGLGRLQSLNLAHNRISSSVEDIDGAFHRLSSLQVLHLNDNKIRSLSADVLRGAESIRELDLRRNNVTSVQNDTFVNFTALRSLKMSSPSFLCDCQLSWFANWLHTNGNETFEGETICFHPPSLKGKHVTEVNSSLFECGEHPIPALEREPTEQSAHKDENVTLECSAIATLTGDQSEADMTSVDMFVVWRRGSSDDPSRTNEVIKPSKSVRIRNQQRREGGHIFFTSVLLLDRVGYEDERDYSCVISNNFGHAASQPARLTVYALPRITKKPENRTVKEGSEVIFNCRAIGHPLPKIAWEKDGGRDFPAAEDYRLLHDHNERKADYEYEADSSRKGRRKGNNRKKSPNAMLNPFGGGGGLAADDDRRPEKKGPKPAYDVNVPLHIVNVTPGDAGEYTCIAESEVGIRTATATLTVQYAPVIVQMKKETHAKYDSHVVFQCSAHSYPKPEVTWYKDGGLLNVTERHFFAGNNQLLVISGAVESDKGLYACAVSNDMGTMRSETKLILSSRNDDGWDIMGPYGIIITSVSACIIITSLVWLIVLCYKRRNQENAPSEQTEFTDCHPADSSSHESMDRLNRLPIRPCHLSSPHDITGHYFGDPPDVITPAARAFQLNHRPVPNIRTDELPLQSAPSGFYRRQNSSRTDAGDGILYERGSLPRRPIRTQSTSQMHRLQVSIPNAPPTFNSTQCIPAMHNNRTQSAAVRGRVAHPKRRKKQRRPSEAGSSRRFTTSESDSGDERGSSTGVRIRALRPSLDVWQRQRAHGARAPSVDEKETLLRPPGHQCSVASQSTVPTGQSAKPVTKTESTNSHPACV